MFSAFLDANVLVPVTLTDTILRCAERDVFRPLWSEQVFREAQQAIRRVRPELSPARVSYRFDCMTDSFPSACVTGYEGLMDGVALPDPADRHVVAAAMRSGADLIVTRNLKDFPEAQLVSVGLEAVDPDCFLQDMLDLDPKAVHWAVASQALDAGSPPRTESDILAALSRIGLVGFAADYRMRFLTPAEQPDPRTAQH